MPRTSVLRHIITARSLGDGCHDDVLRLSWTKICLTVLVSASFRCSLQIRLRQRLLVTWVDSLQNRMQLARMRIGSFQLGWSDQANFGWAWQHAVSKIKSNKMRYIFTFRANGAFAAFHKTIFNQKATNTVLASAEQRRCEGIISYTFLLKRMKMGVADSR